MTQEMALVLGVPESWNSHACVLEVRATQVRRHISTGWSDLRRACSNLWSRHDTTTTPQSTRVCMATPHAQQHSLLAALILGTFNHFVSPATSPAAELRGCCFQHPEHINRTRPSMQWSQSKGFIISTEGKGYDGQLWPATSQAS